MNAKKRIDPESGGYRFRRIPLKNLNSHNFQTEGNQRADKKTIAVLSARWKSRISSLESGGSISSAGFIRRLIIT
jgi:hypothetical protein